jgi:hypothetical protein
LGGEYIGHFQDAQRTLAAVTDHILQEDHVHMECILLNDCPAELTLVDPLLQKDGNDLKRQLKELQQESRHNQEDNEQGRQIQPCCSNGHPNMSFIAIPASNNTDNRNQRGQEPASCYDAIQT